MAVNGPAVPRRNVQLVRVLTVGIVGIKDETLNWNIDARLNSGHRESRMRQ